MKTVPLEVRSITALRAGTAHRVLAHVAGETIWFESGEAPLRASPEAFASAFLLPASMARATLRLEGPLDPEWLRNVERALETFHRWWRVPRWLPEAALSDGGHPEAVGPAETGSGANGGSAASPAWTRSGPDPGRTALFFSGGVDSFYSLLRGGVPADTLVTLHGFDYAAEDRARLEAVERCTREVAAEHGLEVVFVATNVRSHPLIRKASWERVHGGVLAAVGHLLAHRVDRVLISSSITFAQKRDWGSHPSTDPLWSSSRVRFQSVGHEFRRMEKLRQLVDEPLVQRHLRVCWKNDAPTGNCSRCQKCLFTRTVLAECGAHERFTVFEPQATLAAGLDAVPALHIRAGSFEKLSRSPHLDPEVRRAIRDLLSRTYRARSWPYRLRRAAVERLVGSGLIPRR